MDNTLFNGMTFRGYCKRVALSHNNIGTLAGLIVALSAETPKQCIDKTQKLLVDGRIDGEGYAMRMDAITELSDMWKRGTCTHRCPTPDDDWRDLGGGAHMRRTHLRHD
jgi:hypothetical protein